MKNKFSKLEIILFFYLQKILLKFAVKFEGFKLKKKCTYEVCIGDQQ